MTTIHASTALLTREEALELLTDMLKQAEDDKAKLRAALRLAVRYLEHPEVQSIPFALHVSAAAERANAALKDTAP